MGKFIYRALGITAGYGKKIVLKDLSLDLEQGSCTFIIGANGCGKSTLFSVLAGIKKARSGKFLIEGKEAGEKQKQRMTGYAPQESPLFFELSVKDNLLLWYGGKDGGRRRHHRETWSAGTAEETCRYSVRRSAKESLHRLRHGGKSPYSDHG